MGPMWHMLVAFLFVRTDASRLKSEDMIKRGRAILSGPHTPTVDLTSDQDILEEMSELTEEPQWQIGWKYICMQKKYKGWINTDGNPFCLVPVQALASVGDDITVHLNPSQCHDEVAPELLKVCGVKGSESKRVSYKSMKHAPKSAFFGIVEQRFNAKGGTTASVGLLEAAVPIDFDAFQVEEFWKLSLPERLRHNQFSSRSTTTTTTIAPPVLEKKNLNSRWKRDSYETLSKSILYEPHEALRKPGYNRYWSELGDKQKSAAYTLNVDEDMWATLDAHGLLEHFADVLDDDWWGDLDTDARAALGDLNVPKWMWNELVRTKRQIQPVSDEVRRPYRDMRKCTRWNLLKTAAFSESAFTEKFGVELESAVPGSPGHCQVHDELRYVNSEAKTWAVYIYPKSDYNDAFCIDDWFCARALKVANFFSVALVRVWTPFEAIDWLKKQAASGMKIGHLVIGGHGSSNSLQFGKGQLRSDHDDATKSLLKQAKNMMAKEASVFLDSCKTAAAEDVSRETLQAMVARKLAGHHVWGSKISFSNAQVKVTFDEEGQFSAIIDEREFVREESMIDNKVRSDVFHNDTDFWFFEYGYACDNLVPSDPSRNIMTQRDCLKACEEDEGCAGFAFYPHRDERCSFSPDCDATRAPEQILYKESLSDSKERSALVVGEHPAPEPVKSAIQVELEYRRGTSGKVWASINKESKVLLDGDSVIEYDLKDEQDDFLVFKHGGRQKTYWAKILRTRPPQDLVQAELAFTDGSGTDTVFLDKRSGFLIKHNAIKGNLDAKYKVDRSAPKYEKMIAEESIVYTFLKPTSD